MDAPGDVGNVPATRFGSGHQPHLGPTEEVPDIRGILPTRNCLLLGPYRRIGRFATGGAFRTSRAPLEVHLAHAGHPLERQHIGPYSSPSLGPYGGPRVGALSYARGTPVDRAWQMMEIG